MPRGKLGNHLAEDIEKHLLLVSRASCSDHSLPNFHVVLPDHRAKIADPRFSIFSNSVSAQLRPTDRFQVVAKERESKSKNVPPSTPDSSLSLCPVFL